MNKKILNYTLHPITILTDQGAINIPSHGQARCSTNRELIEYIDFEGAKVPVNKTIFGTAGLPEPQEDTVIIVSAIVANVMRDKGRTDLMVVDSPVRDGGKIVGCRALSAVTIYGE